MSRGASAQQFSDGDVPAVIDRMMQRLRIVIPTEGFPKAASFELDDPLLCCGLKSGTTWLQHVVHGLRSGGSMDFEEISDVFPFIEFLTADIFSDMDVSQPPPRICKTHLPFDMAPRTSGKRIIITRY